MFRCATLILLPVTLLTGGCGSGPEVSLKPEIEIVRVVAVLPFSDAPGAEGGYSGRTVASLVAQRLLSMPNLQLVERERIKAVLAEQDIQLAFVKDDAKAARIGQLIGADTVVVGSVTQYGSSSVPMLIGDVFTVGVSFRMVRVDTARICLAARCTQNATSYEEAASKAIDLIIGQWRENVGRSNETLKTP